MMMFTVAKAGVLEDAPKTGEGYLTEAASGDGIHVTALIQT